MLAESLQGQGWGFIVTSNLQRARESGEILGAALQIRFFLTGTCMNGSLVRWKG